MTALLEKLPATIVLGTLTAVFLVTCRKHSSARVRMWTWGWALILSHFAIRLFADTTGVVPHWIINATDSTLLLFGGSAFAVASSPIADFSRCRRKLFLILGTPAVFLSCVAATGVSAWILSGLAAVVMYFGTIVFFATRGWQWSPPVVALYAGLGASGIWSVVEALRGDTELPVLLALMWMFLLAGVLFARSENRISAGVVTTFFGFTGWAMVFALGIYLPSSERAAISFHEFWNVPKYILAFGMVLVLLEHEKMATEEMRERESTLHQQLASFAEVTSRLLTGEDVRSLCGKIADVITSVTTFRRVVVLLADEQQSLIAAGSSGVDSQTLAKIEDSLRQTTPQQVADLCLQGRKAGHTSYVLSRQQMQQVHAVSGTTDYGDNDVWRNGDELLVPIRSPRGIYAGFISLDEPQEVERINPAEMSKLELLADDLGVAIERAFLQREVVRTEKLAGIGQLVAGMAHELNNPLTAVLGYSEMLSETSGDAVVKQQAGVIQRESLRMKKIIENLVRFAKQDKAERKLLSVNESLHEVLKLWSYQAKSRGIELDVDVAKDLPMIRFDETQLKQVLLNVLSNAFEAVDTAPQKRITIKAGLNHGIVTITVTDNGQGFVNAERVFDPFFTTKSVGKGPGLGLSVCYGIVKQHGGEIRAFNVEPHGAGVTIEVPVAQQELALTATV